MATNNVTGQGNTGNILNYSGVLFNKTWFKDMTPLFSAIPSVAQAARKFIVSSDYALGDPSQPAISENDSLTAPTATQVTRENAGNVTQIFQESVDLTYVKMATANELAANNVIWGTNGWDAGLAGLSNNVPTEFDFQMMNTLKKMRNDIEYTILNGVYQEPKNVSTAAKTRGLIAATATNTVAAGGAVLSLAMVRDLAKKMALNSPYGIEGTVAVINPADMKQVGNLIIRTGGSGYPNPHSDAGINSPLYLHTEFGSIKFLIHRYCPQGTIMFANMGICKSIITPTPGKGNFFYEELAKTGAATKGHVFGMWGLDYGPEWYHGKITGLASTFADDEYQKVIVEQ